MADVTDLLTSTTPDVDTLPSLDLDSLVRTGTRRRVAKRASAAVLGLALVVGGGPLLVDVFTAPDVPFVTENPGDASWTPLPDAPLDVRAFTHTYELADGRIVVAGGTVPAVDGSLRDRTDAAVLDADRSRWTSVPPAPFAAAEFGVEFTVRDTTLWARGRYPSLFGGRAGFEDGLEIARIDLDAVEDGWEVLDVLPITGFPEVTVVGDLVVVYGGGLDDASSTSRISAMQTSGAVWRDGTWSTFDAAPLAPMTTPFVAVSSDTLAMVGGLLVDGTTTAAGAVLDLTSLTWTAVPDHPLGPRSRIGTEVDTLVADGRMLVAGGIARHGAECGTVAAPCPESTDAPSGEPAPDDIATGAAWLDLDTLTWEEAEIGATATKPWAVRLDSLSPLIAMELAPVNDEASVTVLADGTVITPDYDAVPFPTTFIGFGADGSPALATTEGIARQPDTRRAALPTDLGWTEVTVPGDIAGVTYLRVADGLLAIGGVSYELAVDSNGEPTGLAGSYNLDGQLEARFLPWRW